MNLNVTITFGQISSLVQWKGFSCPEKLRDVSW